VTSLDLAYKAKMACRVGNVVGLVFIVTVDQEVEKKLDFIRDMSQDVWIAVCEASFKN